MASTNVAAQAATLASQLDAYTQSARSALLNTKDNAVKVAAYCFMVLQHCKGGDGEKWLKAQVDAFNAQVQTNNAPFAQRQGDAKIFKDTGSVPGHFAFETPRDPEEAKAIAQAKTELELDAEQNDEFWASVFQVEIKSIEKSKRIPAVVRVVLGIREKKHSAQVSRYSRAVTWLAQAFEDETPTLLDVLDKLTAMGGLEVVLAQDISGSDGAVFDKADRDNIAAKNEELFKAAVAEVAPKAVISMEAKHGFEDKVILLGRKVENGVAVLGELAMGEGEIKRALRRFDHPGLLPGNATAEFLDRVLQIGTLIEESVTIEAEGDGRRRETVISERKVSLRPGADGRPQLVVSVRHDDVSMVLHATPRAAAIDLGPVSEILLLKRSHRKRLATLIEDPIHRRFLEIEATDKPVRADGKPATSKLGWKITNTAVAEGSKNAKTWIYWSTPTASSEFPLDVMPLNDNGHVRITVDAMADAYDKWAKKLVKPKNGNKTDEGPKAKDDHKFAVAMLFAAEGITLRERNLANDYQLPVSGSLSRGMHLKFAPKDMQAVLAMLLKQPASLFELQPDERGVLAISWMDELAQYRLFVPTCRSKDLSRSDRMLAQMQPVNSAAKSVAEVELANSPDEKFDSEEPLPLVDEIEACRL